MGSDVPKNRNSILGRCKMIGANDSMVMSDVFSISFHKKHALGKAKILPIMCRAPWGATSLGSIFLIRLETSMPLGPIASNKTLGRSLMTKESENKSWPRPVQEEKEWAREEVKGCSDRRKGFFKELLCVAAGVAVNVASDEDACCCCCFCCNSEPDFPIKDLTTIEGEYWAWTRQVLPLPLLLDLPHDFSAALGVARLFVTTNLVLDNMVDSS